MKCESGKLVSGCAILVGSGAAYAYNREHLSRTDLDPMFQEINQQYFDGQLSGVRVEWRTMDDRLGEAQKLGEHDSADLD